MKRAALFGLCCAAAFVAGWLVGGKPEPPPPKVVTVTHTDTLKTRPDTVEVVPLAVKKRINALEAEIGAFFADTLPHPDTLCNRLLAASGLALDSVKQALAVKPAVRLTLSDTATHKWPVKAVHVTVTYAAAGGTATAAWDWREWPAPLAPKSRFGAVFGYGAASGGLVGAQIRIDNTKALQALKGERGWQGALVWYLR